MPRKENVNKVGPKSGRIAPVALLNPQATDQLYRVYNTGESDCPGPGFIISKGCSVDFRLAANTSGTLGVTGVTPTVEAIYELMPSPGLRSGRFRNPGTVNATVISALETGALYRFFNTRRSGSISITVGSAAPEVIANGCSEDFFIGTSDVVKVGHDNVGVYDFLAFATGAAAVDPAVRTGHFKMSGSAPPLTIAHLTGGNFKAVYRIINSDDRDIHYSGMPTGAPLTKHSSCDVEVVPGGSLTISVGSGTGPVLGSYELIKINPGP